MIEVSKRVTVKVESQFQTPSLFEVPTSMDVACRLCTHYIDDLVSHAPLELCSYWRYGQVFI